MMKRLSRIGWLAGLVLLPTVAAPQVHVNVEVGKPAPDFELSDSAGRSYKLSSYRGKSLVVLEFFRSGDW
jgi:AhpC/TSA family